MPHKDWDRYVRAIGVISSQVSLDNIRTSNFSDFKKETRSKIMKYYQKAASSFIEEKKLSLQDAFKTLGRKLNG